MHPTYKEEGSSSDGEDKEVADFGDQAKSAIYDYASEKSMSHEECRMFYQHSREARQQNMDNHGRLSRARTFSFNYEGRASRRYNNQRHGQDRPMATPGADLQSHAPPEREGRGLKTPDTADTLDGADGSTESEEPTLDDAGINPELQEMSAMIQQVLNLRKKYVSLSLQHPGDNPKDHPDWKVYPEPPKPVWTEDTTATSSSSAAMSRVSSTMFSPDHDLSLNRSQASLAAVVEEPARPRPISPPRKQRKPGQDIGSDFDMSYFDPLPGADTMMFEIDQGSVYQAYESADAMEKKHPWVKVPNLREFFIDLNTVKEVSEDGPIKSFAFRELQILDGKFKLHALENGYAEVLESKTVAHRDFYNVRKNDTHIHLASAMNSKHLLRFIKSKLKHSANDLVLFRDGKAMTLQEVFDSLGMTAYDLSIDTLDTHVGSPSFLCKEVVLD